MMDLLRSERRLFVALLALLVLLNVPYGAYALYPFKLFSTWVHEMSHGLAALALGGHIDSLLVYPDGSGLAHTRCPEGRLNRAVVASAGYLGTAVVGSLLLASRGRRLAGPAGLVGLGVAMGASAFWVVRNPFGFFAVLGMGAGLVALGRALSREHAGQVFTFLAATCSLNAITSVRTLFGSNLVVNGQPSGGSDAQTLADLFLLPSFFWAALWLVAALVLFGLGLRWGTSRS